MALDWDVLLDDVSVKRQIANFQIRESKGAYARELTLFAADSSFYDQFDFSVFPKLRIEVKTSTGGAWVSQGKFYIEQPVLSVAADTMLSQGVWGRSETAKIGAPWAVKVSKAWETDTTCQAIMTEMAQLCGLAINFQTGDYVVHGGTYTVEGVYPIDVITEIAGFTGDYIGCSTSGELVVRSNVFHPSAADHAIADIDVSSISENIEYPEFGNRILISAAGSEALYSVELAVLDNTDCLPADGVSTGTLLAFVTNQDGNPANNVSVEWSAEAGVTLDKAVTVTGDYLIDKETVNADNYYKLTVDYPVSDIIGIWTYADSSHAKNLWDASKDGCIFEGNEIIVNDPFTYCDQTLIVSYITAGCAANTVTAGNQSFDVAVTADAGGVQSALDIKLGNSCACGSSLNARAGSDSVCFGNYTKILVWATINNEPALGYAVQLEGDKGCGEQSRWSGVLGYVAVYAEIVTVFNVIDGVSQVKTSMPISEDHDPPRVYRISSINGNRYSSHNGQTIDLNYQYETGVELLVYYTAAGADSFKWKPGGGVITDDDREEYGGGCSSEINITMADGTEQGLSTSINMSSVDCTVVAEPEPPIPDEPDEPLPTPDPDPEPFFPIEPLGGLTPSADDGDPTGDGSDPDSGYPEPTPGGDPAGTFPGEGGGALSPDASISGGGDDSGDAGGDGSGSEPTPGGAPVGATSGSGAFSDCDTAILSKIMNYDAVIGEEEKQKSRYGYTGSDNCAEGFPCSCSEMCESEMNEKGNTYDYPKTIHQQAAEEYEKDTPGYNELYEQLRSDHLAECEANCEQARDQLCDDECLISGPEVLSPGESAEYVCSDGSTATITMPDGACGTQSFTVGCCTFQIRSTDGYWRREYADFNCPLVQCGMGTTSTMCSFDDRNDGINADTAGAYYQGMIVEICSEDPWGVNGVGTIGCFNGCSSAPAKCTPDPSCGHTLFKRVYFSTYVWYWECEE